MKRIIFVVISFLAITSFVNAQKPNVTKAKSLAFATESPNIQGAKDIIEEAIKNEETNILAKTWYVAAEVYLQAAKVAAGENVDVTIGKDALKAYEYLLKAYELDQLPNAKGKVKPKYANKIADHFINDIYNRYALVNYGVKEYSAENFSDAIIAFKKHTEIIDLPMVVSSKNRPEKDTAYYEIRYYSAQCAWAGAFTEDAISIFESLKNSNYKEDAIYQSLSTLYMESKDTVHYVNTLKEGIAKFPKEFYYLGSLINYYAVDINKPQMAKEYVEKAIVNDPNNAQYYVVLGSIFEMSNNTEEAIKNLDKAIALEPNNHEAWNGKGRLIYNKAVSIDSKASAEKDLNKADAMIAEARTFYKESIPYFEKAVELNNDNMEYLKNLRSLYYRFIDEDKTYSDKYQKIDKIVKGY